ncbi:hypothetical protein OQA88_12762 [Cercophora sp. LCS_1]
MDYSAPSSPESLYGVNPRPAATRSWIPLFNKMVVHEENLRVEKQERVSLMFSALPTSIQNRLPPIPSIRRTVTMPMRGSIMHMPFSSGSSTPLSEADTEVMSVEGSEDAALMESIDYSSTGYSSARNFISTLGTRPVTPDHGNQSGVDWRYAKQGLDLVINSGRESNPHPRSDYHYNSAFERSSYVTGVGYLLDGLPRDLDDTEVMMLQRSIPPSLADSLEFQDARRRGDAGMQRPERQRNLVHMIVLHVLMTLQAWICWALPHVLFFLGETMRVEREYKVTQTLLAVATAWFNAVRSMGDGLAGQIVADAFRYTTKGVESALKDFANPDVRNAGYGAYGNGTGYSKNGGAYQRRNRRGVQTEQT